MYIPLMARLLSVQYPDEGVSAKPEEVAQEEFKEGWESFGDDADSNARREGVDKTDDVDGGKGGLGAATRLSLSLSSSASSSEERYFLFTLGEKQSL